MIDSSVPLDILNGEKSLQDVPDYSNEKTRNTENSLGPFVYDMDESRFGADTIVRGPFEIDNGAVYQGSWSLEGLRHGRGIQIW